jgi:predicted ester cyclase
MSPDCIDHNPGPGLTPDRAGHHQLLMQVRTAFPDARFTLDDVIAEGDRVVDRWTMEATHAGSLGGMPPTGRHVRLSGMDILRIADGQIAEVWHIEDTLGMMQQLGAIPAPGQRAG